jgi:hypothetical protein
MSHGGTKGNFQTFSVLEFIVVITQRIPERLSLMVRYVGWYSNRMRGDRRKAEQLTGKVADTADTAVEENEVIVVSGYKPKKRPPLVWRECIKKVWEVDPLLCSGCGGMMKVVSFICERNIFIDNELIVCLGKY